MNVFGHLPQSPQRVAGPLPSARPRVPRLPIPLYAKTMIGSLLSRIMELSGTHQAEVARRMAIRPQSLNQYVTNKRARPSLEWLIHFLQVNGAHLAIVFPETHRIQDVIDAATTNSDAHLGAKEAPRSESKLTSNLESKLEGD